MLTRPPDLGDDALRTALATGWAAEPTALRYEPVGFGAHHWRAELPGDGALFVTAHDLTSKRIDADEHEDEVFRRLQASVGAACALAAAGIDGVLGEPAALPPTGGALARPRPLTGADAMHAKADELVALGATVVGEHDEPGGHWITLLDPEGNELCLQ